MTHIMIGRGVQRGRQRRQFAPDPRLEGGPKMKIRYSKVQRYKYEIAKPWSQKKLGGGGISTGPPERNFVPGPHFSLYGPDDWVTVSYINPTVESTQGKNSTVRKS